MSSRDIPHQLQRRSRKQYRIFGCGLPDASSAGLFEITLVHGALVGTLWVGVAWLIRYVV